MLLAEFIILFIAVPTTVALIEMPFHLVFLPMFFVFICAVWKTIQSGNVNWSMIWTGEQPEQEKQQLKILLFRFPILAFLLLALIKIYYPDNFLNFPQQYPGFFILFIVLYPLLSVIPQEFLYRTFFFKRYRVLFKQPLLMVVASTIVFSYLHIIFHNIESVLLTLIGGYLFSQTYRGSGSLRLVTLAGTLADDHHPLGHCGVADRRRVPAWRSLH